MKLFMKTTLILLAGLFSGCASIVSSLSESHPNRKEISITPGATAITLAGIYPDNDKNGLVEIPRGAGVFRPNTGRVEKDDYMIGHVAGRLNWWIAGNYFYGYIPGLIVDFVSGGAYSPKVVYLKVPEPVKGSSSK